MSGDISAFIGHVVMAMRFVADFIDGMTLDDFLAAVARQRLYSCISTRFANANRAGCFV